MESKTKQILEALQMQPLSDEEKASRHILGRLYGPIATTKKKQEMAVAIIKNFEKEH